MQTEMHPRPELDARSPAAPDEAVDRMLDELLDAGDLEVLEDTGMVALLDDEAADEAADEMLDGLLDADGPEMWEDDELLDEELLDDEAFAALDAAFAEVDDEAADELDGGEAELPQEAEIYLLLEEAAITEIIDAVLDAADVEILEDLGGGPVGADGPEGRAARAEARQAVLLRQLLADVLERYRERLRRQPGRRGGGA